MQFKVWKNTFYSWSDDKESELSFSVLQINTRQMNLSQMNPAMMLKGIISIAPRINCSNNNKLYLDWNLTKNHIKKYSETQEEEVALVL